MKKSLLLIFGLLLCFKSFSQNAYSPEMVKAFADHLYSQGFFDEAESEYKRYLFSTGNKKTDEAAVLNLGNIYFSQKNKTGIMWLKNDFKKSVGFETYERLNYIDFSFAFNERNQGSYYLLYGSLLEDTKRLEQINPEWKLLYTLSYEILEKQIKQAAETANTGVNFSQAFSSIAHACEQYNQKSPGLALGMSAVVPGSGKWYAGNFWAGFTDFIIVGSLTATSAYYGVTDGPQNWRTWTYGSLAALFYIVDLYGSYNGARRYNQAQYFNLCRQVDDLYEQLY